MKIGLRIFLGYFLILSLSAWFILNLFVAQVKPGVRGTLEDTLADTAYLLAGMLTRDLDGPLDTSRVGKALSHMDQVRMSARIDQFTKQRLDYRVYVTDAHGIVVFDTDGKDLGRDFSRWNDVYLTLRGRYGARSSRSNPSDDSSSVMHVAAPIYRDQQIVGVLTVAKPISSVQPFIRRSQLAILRQGGVLTALSLIIGLAFSLWLTRALARLQAYARTVASGNRVQLPDLGNNEIGSLGKALEAMREQLEGKEYAEELMHTLAHELKSPIAAIQSSAELLREPMSQSQRMAFVATILDQNQRQRTLIERLLTLVRIEQQQCLPVVEMVDLAGLIQGVLVDASQAAPDTNRHFKLDLSDVSVAGDPVLLRQAVLNLVANAIDFSPSDSVIDISLRVLNGRAVIEVRDHGEGIPDFALPHIFERFYSLPRSNGQRSHGLGLPFVREVMNLHGGEVGLRNASDCGVIATLAMPIT